MRYFKSTYIGEYHSEYFIIESEDVPVQKPESHKMEFAKQGQNTWDWPHVYRVIAESKDGIKWKKDKMWEKNPLLQKIILSENCQVEEIFELPDIK